MSSTTSASQREALTYAAELVQNAGAIVVAAGAGIGVDSGLPDFRGDEGFWQAYPPLRLTKMRFKDVAAAGYFDDDPYRAWGFYGHRLALYRKTVPHPGFALLQRWTDQAECGYAVLTTNVDGQFQRAGFDAGRLHERHGSIHHLQCTVPCSPAIWPAQGLKVDIDELHFRWRGELPTCPHCGALARPNIDMYGDSRWVAARSDQQASEVESWIAGLHGPLVIEIGAGTGASAIRSDAERIAKSRNGQLVRINPTATEEENADVVITMPALRALKAIERILHKRATHTLPATIASSNPSDTDLRMSTTQHLIGARPVPSRPARRHPGAAPDVGKRPAEHTLRRRLTLLSLLPDPGHPGMSVKNLASKLEADGYPCSIRTVERDLAEMTDQAGVWQATGITLRPYPDPSDPRVQLWTHQTPRKPFMLQPRASEDALLSALLARELQALLPPSTAPASTPHQRAAARIWSRPSEDAYARYQEKISILADGPERPAPLLDVGKLREMCDALLREEQIDVCYLAETLNVEESYRLHPIGLVRKGRFIWLIAAKEGAGRVLSEPSTFRIDRVRTLRRRANEPAASTLPTLQEVLDRGIPNFFPARTVALVLRSRPGSAGDALMSEYAHSPISEDQRIVALPGSGQELSATVRYTRELVSMLQSQAHLAQVLAPACLRQELTHFASLVAEHYGAADGPTAAKPASPTSST